jgi:hypothetical protein
MNPASFDTSFHETISAFAHLIMEKFGIKRLCVHIARFEDFVSSKITHEDVYVYGGRIRETSITEDFAKECISKRNPTGDKKSNTLSVIYSNHLITITVEGLCYEALHCVAGILGFTISTMTHK